MNITTIIVAGGSGSRMGKETPKQFLLLGGLPVLMRTISSIYDAVEIYTKSHSSNDVNNYVHNIIVVVPKEQIKYWKELCDQYNFRIDHQITAGGETRFASVKEGLSVMQNADIVMIHDGARPFVNKAMVDRAITEAMNTGAAIPVIDINDSLREIVNNSSKIVNRSNFKAVQTPQVFKKEVITEAYKQHYDPSFTDDASVVEKAGYKISLVEGDPRNLKITTPVDMEVAEFLISNVHS